MIIVIVFCVFIFSLSFVFILQLGYTISKLVRWVWCPTVVDRGSTGKNGVSLLSTDNYLCYFLELFSQLCYQILITSVFCKKKNTAPQFKSLMIIWLIWTYRMCIKYTRGWGGGGILTNYKFLSWWYLSLTSEIQLWKPFKNFDFLYWADRISFHQGFK